MTVSEEVNEAHQKVYDYQPDGDNLGTFMVGMDCPLIIYHNIYTLYQRMKSWQSYTITQLLRNLRNHINDLYLNLQLHHIEPTIYFIQK